MKKKQEESLIETIIKGPSLGYTDVFPKRSMWQEVAEELNGEFKIQLTAGNSLELHKVTFPHKKWTLQITATDTKPMKVQATFQSAQNFELTLSWEDFIERVLKKFSKPEVQVGSKEFDKRYLIKTNRNELIKRILSKDIQDTLLKYNVYSISYQTNIEKREAVLVSVIQRQIGCKHMILELADMYKKLVDALERLKVIR